MKQKPLPIYLTTEQYAVLRETATRYGRSMTEIVRELIDQHLVQDGPPPTDISGLMGSIQLGHPTNIAEDKDRMLDEALWEDFLRVRETPGPSEQR